MKRRPASRAELLARMPRAFRPKLDASQRRDLGLCHISNLDSIARGEAVEQNLWDWAGAVLTWSKAAELFGSGIEEMAQQRELVARLVNRYRETGRILFSGPDYQLAKEGVEIMDALADAIDRPTAVRAADWGETTLNAMSSAAMAYRAGLGAESQMARHASRGGIAHACT